MSDHSDELASPLWQIYDFNHGLRERNRHRGDPVSISSHLSGDGHIAVRAGRLSWGQESHFLYLAENDMPATGDALVSDPVLLPQHTSIDTVIDNISTLVNRHEALRTAITYGEPVSTYAAGVGQAPLQTVFTTGKFEVKLERHTGDVREIVADLWRMSFDIRSPLLLRIALLCDGVDVRSVVLSVSNQAADAVGFRLLVREMTALMERSRLAMPALHPVDQAIREADHEHERTTSSLSYFRRALADSESINYAMNSSEAYDVQGYGISSSLISEAARRISLRYRVSPASCLMGLMALLVAEHQGSRTALIRTIYSRRHAVSGYSYLAPLGLDTMVPFRIELDQPLSGYLRRTHANAMVAYRKECGPADLARLVRSFGDEQGTELNGFCFFNYLPPPDAVYSIEDRGGSDLRSMAQDTSISPVEGTLDKNTRMFVELEEIGPRRASLSLRATTGSVADIPRFLFMLESLLVDAADPDSDSLTVGRALEQSRNMPLTSHTGRVRR